ncbi:replicative helicase loader/inhibitor [Schinkia azotoformans]|uniref:replicative helicase loader/inhibitor n=1 Tax=Schinkia azotoformans TaxID=1454 RepID=UPI002E21A409|nr:replicative helicase loader/inhibitor [Schinkia azotoformans]
MEMTEEQCLEILRRITAAYPQFDLDGPVGEKRIELWVERLLKMPYEPVLHKLNQYIDIHHFPPTIAQIAVEPPLDNSFLKQQQVWAAQVKAERESGRMKTFLDYLPEELRGTYSRLLEGTHSDK